jgi:Uma2 family endonuclease
MTLEEWADMDEDEPGELVDGRLVEEEVPNTLHEAVASWFLRTLGNWAAPRGGWVFGSEMKFAVSPTRGRKPDVSMFAPGTRLHGDDALCRIPPAVVVEVISQRPRDIRRDRLDKSVEYACFGVRSCWLVEPKARLIELFELGPDGRYIKVGTPAEGAIEVPGFEGLVIDQDELWKEIEPLLDNREEKPTEQKASESGEPSEG